MAIQKFGTVAFGTVAIVLHWAIAALIVIAVASGLITAGAKEIDLSRATLVVHQSFGLIIFTLAVVRITWRLTHPAPPLPPTTTLQQRWAATVTHGSLYLLTFFMPLAGYTGLAARGRVISLFGVFELPQGEFRDFDLARTAQEVHVSLQYVLYALVAAHVIAALYHQFVIRDGLLWRMWFRNGPAQTSSQG
ncbi:MAG: cytochrome b [Rhodospirillaceae bacterium]|nr:cytochrome b [Rhodospirillaceae bacterium]